MARYFSSKDGLLGSRKVQYRVCSQGITGTFRHGKGGPADGEEVGGLHLTQTSWLFMAEPWLARKVGLLLGSSQAASAPAGHLTLFNLKLRFLKILLLFYSCLSEGASFFDLF